MINALSIDLEFWYTAELVRKFAAGPKKDQVLEAMEPLLELLDKYHTKATFFVLGSLAEKYGDLVRQIHENGHEVASHLYSHRTLRDLGREGFEREVIKTGHILSSLTGLNPIGFRAPTFSMDNGTRWAFDILAKNGYRYDSSVFPIKTSLYGVPGAPISPYRPSFLDLTKSDPDGPLIEFPPSVIKFIRNIPISGGFYFRIIPAPILKETIRIVNRNRPAMVYLHPWELNPDTPRVLLPAASMFITYYGTAAAFKKFEYLLKNFKFAPVREVLGL